MAARRYRRPLPPATRCGLFAAGLPILHALQCAFSLHQAQQSCRALAQLMPLPLPTAAAAAPHLVQHLGPPDFAVGWAQSHGNRPYQDDRCVEFLLPLPGGGSALVWAVSD